MKRYISEKEEKYYTHMLKIIKSIGGNDLDYNWLITDIEAYPESNGKYDKLINNNEYLFLSTNELITMLEENDFQWIWGVFSAISKERSIKDVLSYELPYAQENTEIYKDDPIIQHPLAEIEIVAEDSSSCFIVAKDDKFTELFKNIYPNSKENY